MIDSALPSFSNHCFTNQIMSSSSSNSQSPIDSNAQPTEGPYERARDNDNNLSNSLSATGNIAQLMESGSPELEESNTGEDNRSTDVLFRGGFTQGFPSFSVTIDRTNITPDGTVTGEPVFNFGNLPNNLRDLVESVMRSNGPRKKKATKEAIKRLKLVDSSKLKDSEKLCSICYEPFDELNNNDTKQTDKCKVTAARNRELLSDDPPILFPKNSTASTYSEYQRLVKPSAQGQSNEGEQKEHIPVQMPCGHIFGRSCLLEWLKSNISCPLCRREVEAQPLQTTQEYTIDRGIFRNRSECPATWSADGNFYEDPEIPFPQNIRRPHHSFFQ